jgi:hypothetical protein
MTQFEVKRGALKRAAETIGTGMNRHAPSYAPGGIMAMEGGPATMLGLMPFEIRRARPGSTRSGYAKGYAQRGW